MNRKCHYVYDKETGKVLIPGCWPVVNSYEMGDCICRHGQETLRQFESKDFNKTMKEMRAYITALEKENSRLIRILRKVDGFR